ncbi:hypothetical protein [Sporosarcina ureae]|uniref:Uncharacterized protein n=1 Tax=Sporosarcina ureae TaxID=1571 RepID=A0ABM6JRW6_SPOUR|nr:hypothetical protein [Sporosarcina ureae]ARF12918.1 hypothetical protein SporoS204_01240 [Sporosarcina ureae]
MMKTYRLEVYSIKKSTLYIFAICIILLTPMIVFGDVHSGSVGHNDEDDLGEEIGKFMGWMGIALAAVPVALYPAKKIIPMVVRKRKELRNRLVSLLAALRKLHMPIGITVFSIVAWHGVLLFWSEGEFGLVEWIGTISLVAAVIGGMFGASYMKRRKAKPLRDIHIGLLTAAIMIAAVHVLLACNS